MNDKQFYVEVLKVLDTQARTGAIIDALVVLHLGCEDPRLSRPLKMLISHLRADWASAPSVVELTPSVYAKVFINSSVSRKISSDLIRAVMGYCISVVESTEQAWQIIARAAGWTPPHIQ